jgi:hypothetical protein
MTLASPLARFEPSRLPLKASRSATTKPWLQSRRTQGKRAANLRAFVDDLQSQGITSVRSIAAQLNERGILTPRDGARHPTSAARLLLRLQEAAS